MLEQQEIIMRLLFAALLGGLVGFERERKDWAAGIRTHMLASVAAALVMMVSSFGFSDILVHPKVMLDPSRVASSVIIGIGYLGAGMILVLKPGNVKGLTTASGLWATAGIGLAAGGGMYFAAGATTVIVLGILYGMQLLQKRFSLLAVRRVITIDVEPGITADRVFEAIHSKVRATEITLRHKPDASIITVYVSEKKPILSQIHTDIGKMPGVRRVTLR